MSDLNTDDDISELNVTVQPKLRPLGEEFSEPGKYSLQVSLFLYASTDLRLPKKLQKMARNAFRLGVRNFGTASQLTANKQPPSAPLNDIFSY